MSYQTVPLALNTFQTRSSISDVSSFKSAKPRPTSTSSVGLSRSHYLKHRDATYHYYLRRETTLNEVLLSGGGLPYAKGSRLFPVLGLVATLLVGLLFLALGVTVYFIAPHRPNPYGDQVTAFAQSERTIDIKINDTASLFIALALNSLVTLCTEATGYVHGTTLKWALVKQGRLPFNANLRLFTTDRRILSPNGHLANIISIITLVLSYAASSAILLRFDMFGVAVSEQTDRFAYIPLAIISFVPPTLLGTALIAQSVVGFFALYGTEVGTWSTNPLDVASAHFHHNLVEHRPNRCMRSVADSENTSSNPIHPVQLQPSAQASHWLARRVLWLVWVTGIGAVVFGGILAADGGYGAYIDWKGGAPTGAVLWGSLFIGVLQSLLTMSLHCCELIVQLSRDESVWRSASSPEGARPNNNPLRLVMGSWQSLGLLIAKTVVHWLYGQAIFMAVGDGVVMNAWWMCGLAGGMIAVATFVTFVARRRPKGPQPAAYGHIQTLVDLVDEWSVTTVMHWGHKGEDGACHAGTSDVALPRILLDALYAKTE